MQLVPRLPLRLPRRVLRPRRRLPTLIPPVPTTSAAPSSFRFRSGGPGPRPTVTMHLPIATGPFQAGVVGGCAASPCWGERGEAPVPHVAEALNPPAARQPQTQRFQLETFLPFLLQPRSTPRQDILYAVRIPPSTKQAPRRRPALRSGTLEGVRIRRCPDQPRRRTRPDPSARTQASRTAAPPAPG